MLLPWSGNGGTSFTIATNKITRLWVEPWNYEAPIHWRSENAGTNLVGPNNLSAAPDPEITMPNVTSQGYQNIDIAASGFLSAGVLLGYFVGGFIDYTMYIDQNSRGWANVIGQGEVRGVGIGPIQNTLHNMPGPIHHDELDDPACTDFIISPLATIAGGSQSFKAPTLLTIDNQNQNQKLYGTIPIVPAKFGMMRMKPNGVNSLWYFDGGRVVPYQVDLDFADPVNNVLGTTDVMTDGLFLPPSAVGSANLNTFLVDALKTAWGDTTHLTQYGDGKYRVCRATNQAHQSLLSGYPLIEFACTSGTVSVDFRFKMFYQFCPPTTHPSYEISAFGNFTVDDDLSEYQYHAAPCPGFSFVSRKQAVEDMKHNAMARAVELKVKKPIILNVIRDVSAFDDFVSANPGIDEVLTEDDNWYPKCIGRPIKEAGKAVRYH